jgi:hypothetical protein
MALSKNITQEDGVVTTYHRILFVTVTTNSHNSIAVASYINENIRQEEKEGTIALPYMKAVTYETDYDSNMTVEAAYDYLKTLDAFADADDI